MIEQGKCWVNMFFRCTFVKFYICYLCLNKYVSTIQKLNLFERYTDVMNDISSREKLIVFVEFTKMKFHFRISKKAQLLSVMLLLTIIFCVKIQVIN